MNEEKRCKPLNTYTLEMIGSFTVEVKAENEEEARKIFQRVKNNQSVPAGYPPAKVTDIDYVSGTEEFFYETLSQNEYDVDSAEE